MVDEIMPTPRYRRLLRILWTVVWGIAAVLLCVLWVRSYYYHDIAGFRVYSNQWVRVDSMQGGLSILFDKMQGLSSPTWSYLSLRESEFEFFPISGRDDAYAGIVLQRFPNGFDIALPYWLLLPVTSACAVAPRLPCRFSLRALLLALTAVAVVLGLAAYVQK